MLIQVTQKHIDEGERAECETCPVAIAIGEKLKDGVQVQVAGVMIRLFTYLKESIVLPPKSVNAFVRRFDTCGAAEPFEFEIDLPEWATC